MTVIFHFDDFFLDLLQLRFFDILFVHVACLCLTDKFIARKVFVICGDFTLFVVVEDVNHLLVQVKLSFFNLGFSRQTRVKFEPLSHFVNHNFLASVILLHAQGLALFFFGRVESHTSVDKSVLTSLVVFKGLAANLLLAIDETILVPVVVEVEFARNSVNLDQFLPVESFVT